MKTNVVEYNIASSMSLNGLQSAVKDYLNKGWQLQGGVAIAIDKEGRIYLQAVVRYE